MLKIWKFEYFMKKKLSKHEQNCEHGVSEWNKQITTDKFLLTFIMKISHLSNSSQGSHRLREASVWAAIGERVKHDHMKQIYTIFYMIL